jgi:hypothetical protein
MANGQQIQCTQKDHSSDPMFALPSPQLGHHDDIARPEIKIAQGGISLQNIVILDGNFGLMFFARAIHRDTQHLYLVFIGEGAKSPG